MAAQQEIGHAETKISLLKCEKKEYEISPLQIIDFAKIREKAIGRLSFQVLKNSIREKGFLNTISSIWGLLVLPDEKTGMIPQKYIDVALFQNSAWRAERIKWNKPVLALIDGAQRTEAITQLMQEGGPSNAAVLNENTYKIKVFIPAHHFNWNYSEVVAAAHALNHISREYVEVSFWDRLTGYYTIKKAISDEHEYAYVLEYGFSGETAKALFFINAMNGNNNFFEGLVLVPRNNLNHSVSVSPIGIFQEKNYALGSDAIIKTVLFSYNMAEHNLNFYSKEIMFHEDIVSDDEFYTVLKNLNQGILPNLSVGLLNIMEVTAEELKGSVLVCCFLISYAILIIICFTQQQVLQCSMKYFRNQSLLHYLSFGKRLLLLKSLL